jgi:hypothetical protein
MVVALSFCLISWAKKKWRWSQHPWLRKPGQCRPSKSADCSTKDGELSFLLATGPGAMLSWDFFDLASEVWPKQRESAR